MYTFNPRPQETRGRQTSEFEASLAVSKEKENKTKQKTSVFIRVSTAMKTP